MIQLTDKQKEYTRNANLRWNIKTGAVRSGKSFVDTAAMLFGEEVYCLEAEKISQVAKFQGASFKYVYGDELAKWNKEVFEMLKSRMEKPYSCFDGACNPENPTHWLKKFIDSDADIYLQKYTIFGDPFLRLLLFNKP